MKITGHRDASGSSRPRQNSSADRTSRVATRMDDTTMRSGRFSRKPGTRQTASQNAGDAQHRRPHRTPPLEGARALPETDEGHDEERIADADGEIVLRPRRAA